VRLISYRAMATPATRSECGRDRQHHRGQRMSAGSERFLVTGALGCIGAWTVRGLVRDGAAVTALDVGPDPRRLRLIMSPDELDAVDFETSDITDLGALEAVLDRHEITNVIHLAALQVPFCRADPPLGALVNVVGTVNIFEAVRRRAASMAPVVYTSSMAVYSADDIDPVSGRLTVDAYQHPPNHYGVYKQANEGNARIYWLDTGLSSIGVRPMTVYGVGRDQGMTSGPTKAIVAAVLGRPYRVSFGGPTLYQYAADVARTLIAASRSALEGAHVFNLPGEVADGRTLAAAIETVVAGGTERIEFEPGELPFPFEIDHDGIEAIDAAAVTPLLDGIAETVEILRSLARDGRLDAAEHGLEPVAAPN
jgi:UDP-glucuronate 4-epimerase